MVDATAASLNATQGRPHPSCIYKRGTLWYIPDRTYPTFNNEKCFETPVKVEPQTSEVWAARITLTQTKFKLKSDDNCSDILVLDWVWNALEIMGFSSSSACRPSFILA